MQNTGPRREASRRANRGVNNKYNPEEYLGPQATKENLENIEPSARPFLLPVSVNQSSTTGRATQRNLRSGSSVVRKLSSDATEVLAENSILQN